MPSSLFHGQNQPQSINPQIINQARAMMGNMRQIRGIMGMLSGKGMSAEQAVRSICKERGIDVNQLMSQLK